MLQGSLWCSSGLEGAALPALARLLLCLLWLHLEGSTKPVLLCGACSRCGLCCKAGAWQCLLFVLWLSGFESPRAGLMPSALFLSSAKQAGSSQVTFPHTPALPQALGLDPQGWGLGLYQAGAASFCARGVCFRWEKG